MPRESGPIEQLQKCVVCHTFHQEGTSLGKHSRYTRLNVGGWQAFALDRLTKITEGANSHTFVYHNFRRIKSDSQLIDTKTYLISYAYNLASQITSITYPSTHVYVQNYDAIGRVCAIGASGSTCTTGTRYLYSPTYNAAGEALSVTFGNNVLGNFTYNDHLQLSTLRYFKGSTEILNLAYDYTSGVSGNNGQIQKVHYYTTPGVEDLTKSENFTYDQMARLSAAQTGVVNSTSGVKTWSLQWTYDRFGNRLTQGMLAGDPSFPVGQPTLMINSATNQITNSGYIYYNAGNMTHDATAAYAYDGANRLTRINTGPAYTYFGPQRIKKVVGSTTTRYIYSGSKPIAEYVNGANVNSPSTEYVYAGSQLLVTLVGSTPTYHHPDHLSNRAETNSSGTRTRTFGQLPFGETWYETGTADKWKFTGHERDSGTGETGLDYANFRHYSSAQGRFLSADLMSGRLHDPQSLNRYSYVSNDPVNRIDPLGLFCLLWEIDVTFRGSTIVSQSTSCILEIADEIGGQGPGGGATPAGGGPSDKVKSALKRLLNVLDPDCLKFLNSKGIDATKYINDLLSFDGLIAVKDEPADKKGGLEAAHTGSETEGAALTVNGLGAFFHDSYNGSTISTDRGKIKGGTVEAQEFILLHEVAHGTEVLAHDKGDQKKVDDNDKLLEKNCKETIKAFSKGRN